MVSVNLYCKNSKDLKNFLSSFYNSSFNIDNDLHWEHIYDNPIEVTEIIGTYIDNSDKYNISMFISLDENVFINITEENANFLIKYLFERYPY